jgi:hypothetical protein
MKVLYYIPIVSASGTSARLIVPSGKIARVVSCMGVFTGATARTDALTVNCFIGNAANDQVWGVCSNNIGSTTNGTWCFALGLNVNHPNATDGVVNYGGLTPINASLPDLWMRDSFTLTCAAIDAATQQFIRIAYELDDIKHGD